MLGRCCVLLGGLVVLTADICRSEEDLLSGHPRPSYSDVADIDAMEVALRADLSKRKRYSYSRSWWQWDRLRCRFVDEGRRDRNSLKILRGVFRGLILDWHRRLEARGEGDLMYLFFTTNEGTKNTRTTPDGRKLIRDLHGGGYHGGWGGAARMRIYEELVREDMLTAEERARFERIVRQSLSATFLDFAKGHQSATNHALGNGGGPAIALRLFPDAPQAAECRQWLDRVWKNFADFGDWKEWTYYPYGPIFLHGLLDLAEERGAITGERELMMAVARRALSFVHGGGVRGNPNSYAPSTTSAQRLAELYADPWQMGYYVIEQTARDGHFWYRIAQHYKDAEFLWAAEQVILGGRPPKGEVSDAYQSAYDRRFAWFNARGIRPRAPNSPSQVKHLSPLRHRIPERVFLGQTREAGPPFASYFVYDGRGSHLNAPNVGGTLYEYVVNGTKLLGSAGKYTGKIPGGSGAYDSLMISPVSKPFPVGEGAGQRQGRLDPESVMVESRGADSYARFAFDDYFGKGNRWTRETVLSAEGYLVVRDTFRAGATMVESRVGPVWHLVNENSNGGNRNWMTGPAWDRAWWQQSEFRTLVLLHSSPDNAWHTTTHRTSQDISRERQTRAFATSRVMAAGRSTSFLSVVRPYPAGKSAATYADAIETRTDQDRAVARLDAISVTIGPSSWRIDRSHE